jgi:hypothetical protein
MPRHRRYTGKPSAKRDLRQTERRARVPNDIPGERASVSSRRGRSGATMILRLPLVNGEAQKAVTAAFDIVTHWRNDIVAVNERWLTKALDQVTEAHRALGWPEEITGVAKENFLRVSKIQSHMIDQAMEAWQQQLKTQPARSGIPGFPFQALVPSQFTVPASEMVRFSEMTLAPFKLWIEAAEAWQRTWLTAMSGGAFALRSSMARSPSSQGLDASTRESRPSRS